MMDFCEIIPFFWNINGPEYRKGFKSDFPYFGVESKFPIGLAFAIIFFFFMLL